MASPTYEEATLAYIKELAAKPENQSADASWYCIAACSLTAAGQGPLVKQLYLDAIAPFSNDAEARRLILRRIKESLITSSFIFGMPRLLNAFFPLVNAIPDDASRDNTNLRTTIPSFSAVYQRGEDYMRRVFGDGDLDSFLATMEEYWPDLKMLIVNDVYGMFQAEVSIIDRVTTSQINIASLVPMDCPAEVGWHIRGLINNGGSMERLEEAFGIAKAIVETTGVGLKKTLPRVEDVVGKERLIGREG